MRVKINPGKAIGTVKAPPSKSMAHRLLICAALSEGVSRICGISDCDDVRATLECMQALGIKAQSLGEDVIVYGSDVRQKKPTGILNCKESGSTLRFLIPIALLLGKSVTFKGEGRLMKRPLDVYAKLCEERKLLFSAKDDSITVKGPLRGGEFSVAGNVSSQFISGLLFALPLLKRDSRIKISPPIESRSYIEMTLAALSLFGIKAYWEDDFTIYVPANQSYKATEVSVEGDYSGAAFIEALNLFGAEVQVEGLNPDSIQGDRIYRKYFEMLTRGVPTIHIGDCPDLGPILFAVSSAKSGGVFNGTKRLKIKESDRALAMATELKKFGSSVCVYEDKAIVYPAEFKKPSEPLNGWSDHRIVMSLSVLLTLTGGEIIGAECVKKSYPAFFDHLRALGIEVFEYDD